MTEFGNIRYMCVVGIKYDTAPIDVREAFHFKKTDILDVTNYLLDINIEEVVILSTCNKSEIFFISTNPTEDIEIVYDTFEKFFDAKVDRNYFFNKYGDEALKHLFKVTIGYESLVIGEDQILGQVIDSYQTALDIGATKKLLNKIFREAITFAKKIKTESDISSQKTSIAYIGIRKLQEDLDLNNKNILVIGVGDMGKLALEYLFEYNSNIFVSNRTYSNSLKLKDKFEDLNILNYENLYKDIEKMDVVISATASPHTIIKKEHIKKREKPLTIMDLSLPRDVDEDVKLLDNITLNIIDDLTKISSKNMREKKKTLENYLPKVDEIIQEIKEWENLSSVDPVMDLFYKRCNDISEKTFNYLNRKLNITDREKELLKKMLDSSLKNVIKKPLLELKNMSHTNKKITTIETLVDILKREENED